MDVDQFAGIFDGKWYFFSASVRWCQLLFESNLFEEQILVDCLTVECHAKLLRCSMLFSGSKAVFSRLVNAVLCFGWKTLEHFWASSLVWSLTFSFSNTFVPLVSISILGTPLQSEALIIRCYRKLAVMMTWYILCLWYHHYHRVEW